MIKEIEITDLYEAAYYFMHGAKLLGARSKGVAFGKNRVLGYNKTWIIKMADVSDKSYITWKSQEATENLIKFRAARTHVKRFVREHI